MRGEELIIFVIPIVAIVSWALYAIVATVMRGRVRELEVRARIAMIEKGIAPPPEVDPREFDRATGLNEFAPPIARFDRYDRMVHYRHHRRRSAGLILTFLGLALLVMLYPNYRVGGFLVVLGLGFFLNSLLFEKMPPPPPVPPPPANPN